MLPTLLESVHMTLETFEFQVLAFAAVYIQQDSSIMGATWVTCSWLTTKGP